MNTGANIVPRILFVEDNPDDALLAKTAVGKSGIPVQIDFVDNGSDAITLLTGAAKLPDITFLDINLQLVNGLDVLRTVRAQAADRQPVVIVMTTSTDPKDESTARELGCNEFYVKPLGYADYLEIMSNILQRWLPKARSD